MPRPRVYKTQAIALKQRKLGVQRLPGAWGLPPSFSIHPGRRRASASMRVD